MKKFDKRNMEDILALTPMQEGMLLHYLRNPGSSHYFEQLFLKISGEINLQLFKKAWDYVVLGNQMLRTFFRWEKLDKPVQVVLKQHNPELKFFDLSTIKNHAEQQKKLEKIKQEDRKKKFDLREVPFRVILCKVSDKGYHLVINNHHILYDGWSTGVILKEFFRAYEALEKGEAELEAEIKPSFREFIQWHQKREQDKQKKFWEMYFKGFDEPTELPIKRKGIKRIPGETALKEFCFTLEKGLNDKLGIFLKERRLTLAAFFYCAWGILLQTYCNTRDVVFGTTLSGRSPSIKGIENMVGLFINTLPLRVTAKPAERVLDLLLKINDSLPSREKYANTPLVDIKGYSGRESIEDIFDSLLVIENYPLDHFLKGENKALPFRVHCYSVIESTPYDLNIAIALHDIIEVRLIYSEEFFAGDAIIRLSRHFTRILNEIILHPCIPFHAIDILSPGERKQLLLDFNDIGPGFPNDKTIHGMFSAQAKQTPDHIALVGGAATPAYKGTKPHSQTTAAIALTFRELDGISNQLSCFLCGKGVQPGELVALMTRRTIEMIIGILGILKAGCAYVPLNPKTPIARQQFILADCQIKFLLATGELLEESGKTENCNPGGVAPPTYYCCGNTKVEEKKSWNEIKVSQDRNTEVVFLDESLLFSQPYLPEPLVVPGENNLAYVIYTSGSTGNPKGVPITHANFSPLVHWGYKHMGVGSSDRTVQNLSYYFDWSVWEIFIALTSGSGLYMVPGEVVLDSERYFDFIHRHAITVLHITPTHLQSLIRIQSAQKLHMLRHLCIGAEKLNCDLMERSFKLVDERCRIYNMYGPTEATIMAAVLEIDKSKLSLYRELSSVPIGKTLGNLVLLILDRHLNPSPLYVPGELYIGGDGVSMGYLNNPELTAEKFDRDLWDYQDNPDGHHRSYRSYKSYTIYKTGDWARWLSDGTVEFLGRIDHQVKIRGFRIEPGEIEKHLLEHKEVKEALVIAKDYKNGEKYLCAYVVFHQHYSSYLSNALKKYLATRLPDYMVPSSIVILGKMPLNPNGKVDLNALPEPTITSVKEYIVPRSDRERALAAIWAAVLGIDAARIGIDDDFFELGGHSLNVTALIGRIHKELNIEVPFIEIFVNPTVRELAAYIGQKEESWYGEIFPVEEKEYYPLSPAQRRLFVLQQMEAGCTAYNIHGLLKLEGAVDKKKLGDVFIQLIGRHESLRTSFEMIEGEPVQRIHEELEFQVENHKLHNTKYTQDFQDYEDVLEIQSKVFGSPEPFFQKGFWPPEAIIKNFIRPFDLSQAPLLRVGLIELTVGSSKPANMRNQSDSLQPDTENRHGHALLMVDLHHIIADGTSLDVFIKEFTALYRDEELPALHLRYKDFSLWYSERNKSKALKSQKSYWLKQFEGKIPLLNLPTDFARPEVRSFAGAHYSFIIDSEETRALKTTALAENTTLYGILITAFTIFLSKLSGQEDIIIGTPVIGRKRLYVDLAHIIGMFVNTLVLRQFPCGEKRLSNYIKEVRERTAEANENQEYPFEELVENIATTRDPGRNPLFDVMFAMQNPDRENIQIPGLVLKPYPYDDQSAKFDLVFICEPTQDQLLFTVEYCSKIFTKETIKRFVNYFRKIVTEVLADREKRIGDLEIITVEEKQEILYRFNHFELRYAKDKTIPRLFEEQAGKTPDNIAVIGERQGAEREAQSIERNKERHAPCAMRCALTYRELNERSGRLAKLLVEKGVQPDTIVGIMVERSLEMVVGIFGILAAGGAYMPIDPSYPQERINYMLKDSGAAILLTGNELSHLVDFPSSPPVPSMHSVAENSLPATSLAYVIYTSGSTGKPKGVMIEHHSVINRLNWMQEAYPIGPGDVILQKTPVVFDVSVWELFWWSFRGAGLCLLGLGEEKDPGVIAAALERYRVTTMHFVPSMLNAFLVYFESLQEREEDLKKLKSIKQVFSSGEALSVGQVARFYQLFETGEPPKLINLYGPTEATVDVSFFECPYGVKLEKVPIGKPIDNIRLYVLDRALHLQPVGISGELYIAGAGLARGYINRPGLTFEKFCLRRPGALFTNTFQSPITTLHSPIYQTGDLARWLEDGNIEYLGRIDHQVKIRGFRIELEEIESLLTSPGNLPVKEAVVIAKPDAAGDNRLIAYIVPDKSYAFTVFRQLELEVQEFPGNSSWYHWPNHMPVYYLNRMETDFMYKEIFADRSYIKHGITLKEGSCVFDVGANIGVFSLFVYCHCKNARVYSFEPLPPVYRMLSLNTSLYDGDFKTFDYGIGAREGEAVFTYYPHATILSGSSSNQEQTADIVRAFLSQQGIPFSDDLKKDPATLEDMYNELLAERLTTAAYTCKIKSLSQVIEENEVGMIDLLKIDVEKAEMEVLAGIKEEHWPSIRQLVIEVHEVAGEDNVLLPVITRLLENKGYRIAVEQKQLLENTRLYNLYAVRRTGEEIEQPGEPLHEPSRYCVEDLVQETRDYLISRLPEYMVPTHIVPLARLPLTTSGKIDRKALPDPVITGEEGYTAPQNQVEGRLTEIWSEVLGVAKEKIGINDNFFRLGGHSLKATTMISKTHKKLEVTVPLSEVFRTPTIRGLAEYIIKAVGSKFDSIEPGEKREYFGLSSGQKRLYVVQQMDPVKTSYNVPAVFALTGRIDPGKLEDTFNKLNQRHESLRTTFEMVDGEPVQVVHERAEFQVENYKIQNTKYKQIPNYKSQTANKFVRPFDLTRAPLLRVGLLELSTSGRTGKENRHGHALLMFDIHHIVTDGVSARLLAQEFMDLYSGKSLPPLRLRYKDYVQWQERKKETSALLQQAAYWQKQFQNEIPVLELPTDFLRPKARDFAGSRIHFEFTTGETRGLKALVLENGTTLYMVMLSLFNVFLAKLTGQETVVVGTAVAGRRHADLQHIIGMFVNTLALVNFPGNQRHFNEFLQAVNQGTLEAFENQDYPFEELVEEVDITRDTSRNPLFDVMFDLQPMTSDEIKIPGLKLEPYHHDTGISKFDLMLQSVEEKENLCFIFEYSTKLFKETTIRRFIEYFRKIAAAILEQPTIQLSEIEIISEAEKDRILFEFNNTEAGYPKEKLIHQLFEEEVEMRPDRIAVVYEEHALSYRALDQWADRLAVYLRDKGVKPGEPVGIMLDPSLEVIVGVMAILKAGGAYLPIDPGYPRERKQYMLLDSNSQLLLAENTEGVAPPTYYCSRNTQVPEEKLLNENKVLQHSNTESTKKEAFNNISVISVTSVAKKRPSLHLTPAPATCLAYIIYTSGSTGRPKGVMVEHRNIVRLMFNDKFQFDFNNADVWTMFHSYCFDFSVWEMYGALLYGGKLVLIPKVTARDSQRYMEVLKEQKVTILNQTPSAFYNLINLELQNPRKELYIRWVIFGGEALTPVRLKEWKAKYPGTKLINMYGITETTVHVTFKKIKDKEIASTASSIGKPIPTLSTYVLDKALKLLPIGIPGELCVGGKGVGRGYLNQPELTGDKFINNPYIPGERLYRSGDLVKMSARGDMEYLGRMDHQVKIRGFRIELAEIESQLLSHGEVEDVVVIVKENNAGDKHLCAYVASHKDGLTAPGLREYLLKKLPGYMVPSFFIFLGEIPLTPNGKVDRKSLPEPGIKAGQGYTAPGNKVEEKLVGIWAETLGIPPNTIGIDCSFFELGGHSLKAALLAAKIHKALDVSISLVEIFSTPTIRELAAYTKKAAKDKYISIKPVEKKEYYILSSAQGRLYVLHRMDEQGIGYNIPSSWNVEGDIDTVKFEKVFRELIQRHESLRTSFHLVNDEPVQRIHDEVEFEIEYYKVEAEVKVEEERFPVLEGTTGLAPLPIEPAAAFFNPQPATALINSFIRPFDLSQAPLFRVGLAVLEKERYLLLVDMHHIISDGTSTNILVKDFMTLYRGKDFPGPRIQYKDFSGWQMGKEHAISIKLQEEFWLKEFAGEIPVLNLPTDYTRPVIQGFEGSTVTIEIGEEETRALKQYTRDQGATLFMVLFAITNILLSRLSGQEDIIIGSPIAGRRNPDLEPVIGMFVNTLALRNFIAGDNSFSDLLAEVKRKTLKAYENQEYPFEKLVEVLDVNRDASRNPLFDVLFVLQNIEYSMVQQIPGLIISHYPYEHRTSKFDLHFNVVETGDKLSLTLEYSINLFRKQTALRIMEYFKRLTAAVIENPRVMQGEIEIIGNKEREEIIRFSTGIKEVIEDNTIHRLFEQKADQLKNQTALSFRGQELTYEELNKRSNRLAKRLREMGVGPDTIVGLIVERSFEMVIGIVGILKAGGAYLPIDSDYPGTRKKYMLRDSNVPLVLTNCKMESLTDCIPGKAEVLTMGNEDIYSLEEENPGHNTNGSNLVYLIYTSGSTGKPKGIMMEHLSLVNLINYQFNYTNIPFNRVLQFITISFDVSFQEIFSTLLAGGTLYLMDKETRNNIPDLFEFIKENEIETLFLPASFLKFVMNEKEYIERMPTGVRHIVTAGEQVIVSNRFRSYLKENQVWLHNHYGPAETHVVTTLTLDPNGEIPELPSIGKPISNTGIYILDKSKSLQPIGVPGELFIGGIQVSRGYRNREELTSERFLKNPFTPGEQMYNTGDLGRWLMDGNIEFLGRMDFQVKIRGFRVELGEVESQLLTHNEIKEAVVILREENQGNNRYLCGYFVSNRKISTSELREYLLKILPDYMVPSYFVQVEKIPITPNGKTDRRSLPTPEIKAGAGYVAPRNKVEKKLAEIWAGVLTLEKKKIGIDDNFFQLGGHSLKATILISRIYKELNVKMLLAEIFTTPTIRGLSEYMKDSKDNKYESIPPLEKKEYYELSSSQRRLYILQQMDLTGTGYNMPGIFAFEGKLNPEKFEKVFHDIVNRHEAFCTSFCLVMDEMVQKINEQVGFKISCKKLSSISTEEDVKNRMKEFVEPFDLNRAPLLRIELIELDKEKNFVLFDMHHIISDGISMEILVKDFARLYEGKHLEPLPIQYKDYAEWQNKQLNEETVKVQERYWLKKLEGFEFTQLPIDYFDSYKRVEGKAERLKINTTIYNKIETFCNKYSITKFVFMITVFEIALARKIDQADITIGTPVLTREHPDLRYLIGIFLNVLLIRTIIDEDDSFLNHLLKNKETVIEALNNLDYPYELLDYRVKEKESRFSRKDELLSILFNYFPVEKSNEISSADFEIRPLETREVSPKYDLTLYVYDAHEYMTLSAVYKANIYDEYSIKSLLEIFLEVINRILENEDMAISKLTYAGEEGDDEFDAEYEKYYESEE